MAAEEALSFVNTSFQDIEENVEHFISHDKKFSASILSVLRDVFNRNKKDERICGRIIEGCPFECLQLDSKNFDNEIIWQQIQLQNESLLPKIQSGLKPLLKKPNTVQLNDTKSRMIEKNGDNFINEIKNSDDSLKESTPNLSEGSEIENSDEENSNEELPKATKSRLIPEGTGIPRGSVVDDQFFKLADMEKFVESENGGGNMLGDESDENIDYFMDLNEASHEISNLERYDVCSMFNLTQTTDF